MAKAFDTFAAPALKKLPSWITPNRITVVRAFVMPLVILTRTTPWLATTLFVIGCLLDAVDGALSRVRNQTSTFGEWADPIVDKTHVHGTMWLACRDVVGFGMCTLVSSFDILLTVVRYFKDRRGITVRANSWGGRKMWCQSFAVSFVLTRSPLFEPLISWVFVLAIGLALDSLLYHIEEFQMEKSPS